MRRVGTLSGAILAAGTSVTMLAGLGSAPANAYLHPNTEITQPPRDYVRPLGHRVAEAARMRQYYVPSKLRTPRQEPAMLTARNVAAGLAIMALLVAGLVLRPAHMPRPRRRQAKPDPARVSAL
jgi:hypothetical protein